MRHSPRAGSLQFWPIRKSKRPFHTFRKIKALEGVGYFAAYKVGMASALYVDTYKNSPTFKQEIVEPVTVLEAPPLRVIGLRLYKDKKVVTDIWSVEEELKKYISRKIKVKNSSKSLEEFTNKFDNLRLIVCTQPWLIKLKKTPEIFEIEVGETLDKKIDYAKSILGKEINVRDVFKAGDFVDVASVTKGKGFSGAVRRYGIRLFPWKAEKVRRRPGAFGTEGMSKTIFSIPQHGRLGFNSRTEYNKLILGIVDNLNKEFLRYGKTLTTSIIIKGSVPGPTKRLVLLRKAIRQKIYLSEPPRIVKIE
ncbi:MAG: 50S ribosomal protein L3 [Candidatus Rehaiarchaeum fermentans]|nr:50S ribosomal protein L3 [Candidatus Rehaiarchaeum fermentans]